MRGTHIGREAAAGQGRVTEQSTRCSARGVRAAGIRVRLTVLGVAWPALVGAQGVPRPSTAELRYTVTLVASADDRPREVQVGLEFVVQEPVLAMDTSGLGGPPGGVAAFVRDVRVERVGGGGVGVRHEGAGHWRLDARPGERLRASYVVTLGHDSIRATGQLVHPWAASLADVAFAKPGLAYLTGRALFMTPRATTAVRSTGVRVALSLPARWRAVTSWESAAGGGALRAGSLGELLDGFVVVGAAEAIAVERGRAAGLALEVVTWGAGARAEHSAITRVAAEALGMYSRVFGRVPAAVRGTPLRRVAIVVADEEAPARAGAALLGHDAVVLAPAAGARAARLGAVAHELFHLWSGRAFSHRTPAEQWFAEGVAEYYALHALRRAGVLSDSGYAEALDAAFARFRLDPWIGVNSIARAGGAIGEHRALVHDGGLLTAACLDPDIRTTTQGAKDLNDLMRALFTRHDAADRRYDSAALYDAIRTVSDDAVARRISRVVDGSAPLALWRCATEPGRR